MRTTKISNELYEDLVKSLNDNSSNLDIIDWQVNKEILKGLYNIDHDTTQTQRAIIKDKNIRKQITSVLEDFGFTNGEGQGWMCYSRAYLPTALHVDVPQDNVEEDGYTVIIPLTTDPGIKTLVFKEKTNNPILDYWIQKQDWSSREKLNNLSKTYNVSNSWYWQPDIVDYMELDGIADWEKGNAFCLRRSQIHCSTNFRQNGFEYKDYILVQTNDRQV
jgi:hypothetical protein